MRSKTRLIRGLQYFDAVARHQSVKLAAAELEVSQSAVSHQMRELTASLGENLIVRSGRGIALTAKGRLLAERLAVAFESLERSVRLVVGNEGHSLALAVCTSFGPGWLAHRLHDFFEKHPGIDIHLHLYAPQPFKDDLIADAIIAAEPIANGIAAMRLFDEHLIAVHAPGFVLGEVPRLVTTDHRHENLGQEWTNFAAAGGIAPALVRRAAFQRCTHYAMALELAKAGHGVALVPDFLADRELKFGTLVRFRDGRQPSGRTYNFHYKASRAGEPALEALMSWLKIEVQAFAGATLN